MSDLTLAFKVESEGKATIDRLAARTGASTSAAAIPTPAALSAAAAHGSSMQTA